MRQNKKRERAMSKRGREVAVRVFAVEAGGIVKSLRVQREALLESGQLLGYIQERSGMTAAIKNTVVTEAGTDAVVVRVLVVEGQSLEAGAGLFEYRMCGHALVVSGMCSSCHALLSKVRKSAMKELVQLQPSQPDMLFNKHTATRVNDQTVSRLLRSRKLSLVLDLDLTLLHATHDARHARVAAEAPPEDVTELHEFEMGSGHWKHWVKLRPGLRDFLRRANDLFELHIFTHGAKEYGLRIASVLDASGEMFAAQEGIGEKRITTLDDAYGEEERLKKVRGNEYKRLERLFPVSRQHVLVLDDNNVWGDCPNVLRVVPFIFFNPRLPKELVGEFVLDAEPPPPPLPLSLLYYPEAARETHLQELMHVLERVHELFFQDTTKDVATLFGAVRREILRGCKIVLSGVYAASTPLERKWLVMLIADYGGEYCENLQAGVTHVVAAQQGTGKVKEALAVGVTVVHVDWLIESIRHFRRMDEAHYSMLPNDRRSDLRLDKLLQELAMSYCSDRAASATRKIVQHREEDELMEMLQHEMDQASESHNNDDE